MRNFVAQHPVASPNAQGSTLNSWRSCKVRMRVVSVSIAVTCLRPLSWSQRGRTRASAIFLFAALLESWCAQTDAYLAASVALAPSSTSSVSSAATSVASSGVATPNAVPHSAGPQGIFDFWRFRMQRLTSVTEQLRRKHVRTVASVLTVVTKGPPERVPPSLFGALRRWKEVDLGVSEAANEAKDNVKYLGMIERFTAPLYPPAGESRHCGGNDMRVSTGAVLLTTQRASGSPPQTSNAAGTPDAIADSLPALLSGIRMVHTIARYFHTAERMTDLFIKLTHTLIAACVRHVLSPGPGDEMLVADSIAGGGSNASLVLWKLAPVPLVDRLRACERLLAAYRDAYSRTKERLALNPRGRHFDFAETSIFGRFDLFVRRAGKLIDLFTVISQFRALTAENLEGMRDLSNAFSKLAADFAARRHDLLAFLSTDFDLDYVEFMAAIDALDVRIGDFVAASVRVLPPVSRMGALGEPSSTVQPALQAPPVASSSASSSALLALAQTQLVVSRSTEDLRAPTIIDALSRLNRFALVMTRPAVAAALGSHAVGIFIAFGSEIDMVGVIYEENKHAPPRARNMPPVAGNISWARHLTERLERPMLQFTAQHPGVFADAGREGRRVVKSYNRVLRALVAYEMLWASAWAESVDAARSGLSAPLIVRHPDDRKLYVNLDGEVLQLMRETRCLRRLGIQIPVAAADVFAQETRLKGHHAALSQLLREFDRISRTIIPVTAALLSPALRDIEVRLRPGQVTLTWMSLNIDAFVAHVRIALARLETLLGAVNDIVTGRVEKNLHEMARTMLITFPTGRSFTLDEFVALQESQSHSAALAMQSKNVEVEAAVAAVIAHARGYVLDASVDPVTDGAAQRMIQHYNMFAYAALLNAIKTSLTALRLRVGGAASSQTAPVSPPFFDVEVQLTPPIARLSPSLHEVQVAVNRSAAAVLSAARVLLDWGSDGPSTPAEARNPFFGRVTCDVEVVRTVLHLTGAVAGTHAEVTTFIDSFEPFRWLWADDADAAYRQFLSRGTPSMDDYERELARFSTANEEILGIVRVRVISALSLSTSGIVAQLCALNGAWRRQYADNLHRTAATALASLTDYFKGTLAKLSRAPDSLDAIKYLMDVLGEVRDREACIDAEMSPICDMYALLEVGNGGISASLHSRGGVPRATDVEGASLPLGEVAFEGDRARDAVQSGGDAGGNDSSSRSSAVRGPGALASEDGSLASDLRTSGAAVLSNDEMDNLAMLRTNWTRLREKASAVGSTIASLQGGFRTRLLVDVKAFRSDVTTFRDEFLRSGPGVAGILPDAALERLRRFEDELDIRTRKRDLFCNGEDLFALPRTEYAELDATIRELSLLSKLYGLYRDVMARMLEWRSILWVDVVSNIGSMVQEMDAFSSRCRKMPKRLRGWDAYGTLKKQIEDFQLVLPLLQELSKASVQPRHWEAIERITAVRLNVTDPEFKLSQLLAAPLVEKNEDIAEVTDGADKELAICRKLDECEERWAAVRFIFGSWKARGVPVLQAAGSVVEELEEAQLNLQTMLTMRYVAVFRERAVIKLKELSDTGETLELWQKVQLMWCSLESVFTGGDIAKLMPVVAKKFQKVDKDFAGLQSRAAETGVVTAACGSELLRLALPPMFEELERCQKSLEGYLEQKRNKFPRFYFVSNPVLLQILSQGSDPAAVQAFYEKIFDSISYVEHDRRDVMKIIAMVSREGRAEERISFARPVTIAGNIEDWLNDLLREMRRTMKIRAEEAAGEAAVASADLSQLRRFVDGTCGQYALLGLQLMWTADVESALMSVHRDKNAMKAANKKALDILSTLSSWCITDLGTKMNRTKVETLVTIQVHQRDVVNDIATLVRAKRIAGADDFEWLKQARFYWDPDGIDSVSDAGAIRARITDVSFNYEYEYLGCKERLVITPLTDR